MCVRCVCVALVFLFFILITLGYILYFTLLISSVIFLSLSLLLRLFFISPLCEMKNGPPAVSVTLWEDERVKMNMRMRMRLFEWRCVTAGQAKVVREMSLVIPDFLTHGLSPLSLSLNCIRICSRARVSSITLISRLGVRCNCTVHIFTGARVSLSCAIWLLSPLSLSHSHDCCRCSCCCMLEKSHYYLVHLLWRIARVRGGSRESTRGNGFLSPILGSTFVTPNALLSPLSSLPLILSIHFLSPRDYRPHDSRCYLCIREHTLTHYNGERERECPCKGNRANYIVIVTSGTLLQDAPVQVHRKVCVSVWVSSSLFLYSLSSVPFCSVLLCLVLVPLLGMLLSPLTVSCGRGFFDGKICI